jgi:hypothetical protein
MRSKPSEGPRLRGDILLCRRQVLAGLDQREAALLDPLGVRRVVIPLFRGPDRAMREDFRDEGIRLGCCSSRLCGDRRLADGAAEAGFQVGGALA